jgi:hypothetical protein
MAYDEDRTNTTYILDTKYALFASYLQTPKVYLCPTDRPNVQVNGRSLPRVRSYALNAYVGTRTDFWIFGEFSGWDGAGGEVAFRVKAVGLG